MAVRAELAGHTGNGMMEDCKPPIALKPKKKSGLPGKRSALGIQRPAALTIPNMNSETGSADAEVGTDQAMQHFSCLLVAHVLRVHELT
jgi:hypothetical protein